MTVQLPTKFYTAYMRAHTHKLPHQ